MGSKIEYVESSHMYATNYIRNSKAIGVLWAIFSICYAIIATVAFLTPEWIGDVDSEYPSRLGIWQSCRSDEHGETCTSTFDDFLTNVGSAQLILQISSILVGIAVALAILTIFAMLLFFFCQSSTVFRICGWLQFFSGLFLISGLVAFPGGWNEASMRESCGQMAGQYQIGQCTIRWAYFLAVIACLDGVVLSILAFILGTWNIRLEPDSGYPGTGSLYKGEVNNAYVTDAVSVSGSRKSLALQPVLIMHPHIGPTGHIPSPLEADNYSQFSNRTGRSKHSMYGSRADYPSSIHNF